MSDSYTPVQGLILLAYNAYYNRFLKFEASLQDYLDNSEGSDYLIKSVNFNPADGLNTIHVAGNGELDNRLEFRDYSFTYALLIEYNPDLETREEIYADEDTHILSKWFILDNDRTRGGQYRLSLRRDVLVDYMKQIKKSPIFVDKGILTDPLNPLLLNNEDVRVNQIKRDEVLLKDLSGVPWLVMYLKKGVLGNSELGPDENGKIPINVPSPDPYVAEEINTPITSWAYYQYISNDYKYSDFNTFWITFWNVLMNEQRQLQVWDNAPNSSIGYYNIATGNLSIRGGNHAEDPIINGFLAETSTMRTQANTAFGYKDNANSLWAYNDKIIKDSQGKYFKVRVYQASSGKTTHDITSSSAPALKSTMTNIWNTATGQTASPDNKSFKVKVNWISIRIELTELKSYQTEVDFGAYTEKGTLDSPLFDAICLPYGAITIKEKNNAFNLTTSAERSLQIMNSLATQLTSQYVLDLQLLPYCPLQSLITASKVITVRDINKSSVCGKYSSDYTDCLLVAENANFSLDINKSIEINGFYDDSVSSAFKMKFLNDCTMVRLCSPNYNGLFEFNLAKNGGKVNKINADITLRPFNPYIHLNPDFDHLYGTDFNDIRGLVCNGDFSLGIINDAWNVYEIQNKNYQAIFDRQIQNLDVNNAIVRQEAGWGMAAGVVSGAASGAAGGAIVGGGWGALAGAVIGAGTSAIGGALDLANLQKRQQEARSYAIDNYNLQLGNVRALPYSITKTSALTYNNKLFPFIEIYTCSEEEEWAYYLKLWWNGMTIGRIDDLPKYTSGNWANFFRGKLVALYGEEGSNAVENRIIEAINDELMKGVFI